MLVIIRNHDHDQAKALPLLLGQRYSSLIDLFSSNGASDITLDFPNFGLRTEYWKVFHLCDATPMKD